MSKQIFQPNPEFAADASVKNMDEYHALQNRAIEDYEGFWGDADASRARASYMLCEKGDQQPRSLSVAFLNPVAGSDLLTAAIESLNQTVSNMDKVYELCADARCTMNAASGEGSLAEIVACATE